MARARLAARADKFIRMDHAAPPTNGMGTRAARADNMHRMAPANARQERSPAALLAAIHPRRRAMQIPAHAQHAEEARQCAEAHAARLEIAATAICAARLRNGTARRIAAAQATDGPARHAARWGR